MKVKTYLKKNIKKILLIITLFCSIIFTIIIIYPKTRSTDTSQGLKCLEAKDYKCAFSKFLSSAKHGDAIAQYTLASMYYQGVGVQIDYFEAVKSYTKAAKQNNGLAQDALGHMYSLGYGVRKNLETAKHWFGKSCDNQFQPACDAYAKLVK